jgi:hypothetical protein
MRFRNQDRLSMELWVILVTTQLGLSENTSRRNRIENGYFPALELARNL